MTSIVFKKDDFDDFELACATASELGFVVEKKTIEVTDDTKMGPLIKLVREDYNWDVFLMSCRYFTRMRTVFASMYGNISYASIQATLNRLIKSGRPAAVIDCIMCKLKPNEIKDLTTLPLFYAVDYLNFSAAMKLLEYNINLYTVLTETNRHNPSDKLTNLDIVQYASIKAVHTGPLGVELYKIILNRYQMEYEMLCEKTKKTKVVEVEGVRVYSD